MSTIGLTLVVFIFLLRTCGGGHQSIELTLSEDEPVATSSRTVSRLSGAFLTCNATFAGCSDPTWEKDQEKLEKLIPKNYCDDRKAGAVLDAFHGLAATRLKPLDCGKRNWRVKRQTQTKLGEYLAECRAAAQKDGISEERKHAFEAMCQDYLNFAKDCWSGECGNFVVDKEQGETCDEGTTRKTATCAANCGKTRKSVATKASRLTKIPKPKKEICNNDRDDDGDGKVDCKDREDCAADRHCLRKVVVPKDRCAEGDKPRFASFSDTKLGERWIRHVVAEGEKMGRWCAKCKTTNRCLQICQSESSVVKGTYAINYADACRRVSRAGGKR